MLGQIKSFTSKASGFLSSLNQHSLVTDWGKPKSVSASEIMHYPIDLRGEIRPCIEFSCFDTSSGNIDIKSIYFPAPGNIAINDGAQYNALDLGALGGALDTAVNAAKNAGGGITNRVGAGVDSILTQANAAKGEMLAAVGMMTPGIGERVSFNQKKILNPNTNQAFQGNTMRTFSFAFKMIARSQQEANMMRKIHETFRRFTYANSDGNRQNLTLQYPPVWRIRFLDSMANENNYIPKIHSCYLSEFNTTINASNNIFNVGGDPLEVDVSMSYVETRTLTRHDIDTLGEDENRGIGPDGQPTTQPTNAEDVAVLENVETEWEQNRADQAATAAEAEPNKELVATPTTTPTDAGKTTPG